MSGVPDLPPIVLSLRPPRGGDPCMCVGEESWCPLCEPTMGVPTPMEEHYVNRPGHSLPPGHCPIVQC